MSIGNKSGTFRKPGCRNNFPNYTVTLEFLRLRNGPCLVGFDLLDVHSLSVGVSQVLTVRRNRPALHWVLAGTYGELAKLQRWPRRCLMLRKPENRTRDQ